MTNVDIANMALSLIGEAPTVTSLAAPAGSPHAALCALWLPKAREQVLSIHDWTFASARSALTHVRVAVSSASASDNTITTAITHNIETDHVVRVVKISTGGALPTPLEEDTDYYAIDAGTALLQLADTAGGDAIDLTSSGSGTWVIEKRSDRSDWDYAYAAPTDMLRPLRVMPHDTTDEDFPNSPSIYWPSSGQVPTIRGGFISPPLWMHGNADPLVKFKLSRNPAGEQVIYTDQEDADLAYIAFDTEPTGWPPLFEQAVVWKLAAYLAGAIKRDTKDVDRCEMNFQREIARAAAQDSRSAHIPMPKSYPWDR
jgi:hypothetical protein